MRGGRGCVGVVVGGRWLGVGGSGSVVGGRWFLDFSLYIYILCIYIYIIYIYIYILGARLLCRFVLHQRLLGDPVKKASLRPPLRPPLIHARIVVVRHREHTDDRLVEALEPVAVERASERGHRVGDAHGG